MKPIHLILLILVGLLTITPIASAATGTGQLYVTNAPGIEKGDTATVDIYLQNTFDPKIGTYEILMYFDNKVAKIIDIQTVNAMEANPSYGDNCAFVGGFAARGYNNGDLLLATVTLEALLDDGSFSDLEMEVVLLKTVVVNSKTESLTVSIQNGTFTTVDKVKPIIDVTTKSPVSSTFNIAGTITDVGGMGTAQATLKNVTDTVIVPLTLPASGPIYSFNEQVTWPAGGSVDLTIDATDAAGNHNSTAPLSLKVVGVGFSDFEPADGSHIKAIPEYIRAFMTEINPSSVKMYLGSAALSKSIDLKPDTATGYAKSTESLGDLADGIYWVNVSGTGTDSVGGEWFGNWTFTLDTIEPEITTFDIADSDGDGYIEAGEELSLSWGVTESNFDRVALVDVATGEELWSNTAQSGDNVKVPPIKVGNRDLEFRAYDEAGNYDSRAFHLYNNYMIWVNSTKVGEVSGIDTTYTAVKDLSRIDVSSIILHNACTVTLPRMSILERTVTNLGWVTSDTYVTADNTIDNDLKGDETYQNAWVYDPGRVFDFTVKVPNTQKAVLVLAEANEPYIADLIEGGRSGIRSVDYMDLIEKTAYIFIDGGWTKVIVDDDGTTSMPLRDGKVVTNPGNISATLRHRDNQVNLDAGYKLSAQNLKEIKLPPGDYALAAIAMDGDRLGILGMMPVMVMESDTQGWLNVKEVVQGDDFTARFATPCERLGVVLIRDVTYKGNALIDAVTLGKETLHLNLTYNDIPATQKLIGNVYVSPSSGKYVVANTNQTTISTSGLDPGSYQVYMVGQSAKGTIQAYGLHPLTITAKTPVEPTPTTPPYTPGRGGGGASPAYTSYTGTGTLKVNNVGTVLRSIKVNADDRIGSVLVPIGVKALDKDGNPLSEVTLTPLSSDDLPAVPSGALFSFAGYVYEAGPSGATFDPGITLTFELPADAWNALDPDNNDFKVKWYNEETEEWEDVPTTTYRSTRSVDAKVTHFSTFALFTEPGIITPPTETETPTVPTTPTPPPEEKPPADKFPMTTVLAIFAVLVIVIAAGYFFMMRK